LDLILDTDVWRQEFHVHQKWSCQEWYGHRQSRQHHQRYLDAFCNVYHPHLLIDTVDSRIQAEEWQKKNDDGLKKYYSETDRRLLWGSWGDWDLSKPEVWK
jgi:hypothetical protein